MERIPEHILIEIFEKLDKKSIEAVADVCLSWRNLVSTSKILMNRLDLIIDMRDPNRLERAVSRLSSLPYKSIIIKPKFFQGDKDLDMTGNVFKNHSSQIDQVEFYLASSKTIVKLLNSLAIDKITSLTITQGYKEFISPNRRVELPNLKHFVTHQASGLLEVFQGQKIENVQIYHDNDCYEQTDNRIGRFLMTCSNLKTLLFDYHFPVLNVDLMPFKLLNLTVSNVEERPKTFSSHQYETLTSLLAKNLDNLEFLLLGNFSGLNGILEFLMPRVKKLCYLFLIHPVFTKIDKFSCRNNTIKDLTVKLPDSCDPTLKMTRKIIAACSAIEKLKVSTKANDVSATLRELARSQPNLKKLSISTVAGRKLNKKVTFGKLQELHVEQITKQSDVKSLVDILMASPNLEKLTIEMWGGQRVANMTKERLKKVLKNCTKLSEIWISGLFKLPKIFVDGLLEVQESALRKLTIETFNVDMIRANSRRLWTSKIQCTAVQRKSENDEEVTEPKNTDWVYQSFEIVGGNVVTSGSFVSVLHFGVE